MKFALALVSLSALVALTGCAPKTSPKTTPKATPPATTPAVATPGTSARPEAGKAATSPASAPATPTAAATAAPAAPRPAPLVGPVTRAAVEEYVTWRELRAQDYTPDAAALEAIRTRAQGVDVLLILGTWCGDSKRDVPRFFKIADLSGFPVDKVKMVAVDRTKKDADGLTEKYQISRVPTFVFFRSGQELGRVTERPTATLEADIAAILTR